MVAEAFSADPAGRDGKLRACAEGLYSSALPALRQFDPARGYPAVAALSGHLAAMDAAVFPVAASRLGSLAWLAAACQEESRQVARALRHFERLLSGQSRAVRVAPGSVQAVLKARLGEYRAAEEAVLSRLDLWLTAPERAELAAAYHAAVLAAPARPPAHRLSRRGSGRWRLSWR